MERVDQQQQDRDKRLSAIAYLEAGFQQRWSTETKAVWLQELDDCRPDLLWESVRRMVRTHEGMPLPAVLRRIYAEVFRDHTKQLEHERQERALAAPSDPERASANLRKIIARFRTGRDHFADDGEEDGSDAVNEHRKPAAPSRPVSVSNSKASRRLTDPPDLDARAREQIKRAEREWGE